MSYRLRDRPEDFVVEEVPLFEPSGSGEHTFVRVEKRLRTTEEVAKLLARAAGAAPRDVGYAGRKDRRAVATQWFSVPGFDPERALRVADPGVRVLEAVPHPHKLRTGALRGNRFRLRVAGVDPARAEGAAAALAELVRRGLPNRFGAQRFGREGDNAERGRALLAGEASGSDRRASRFLLSALQAAVFNDVLERRPWPVHELRAGDIAVVEASGGPFLVEDVSREQPRADAFEVSPTGPIFGTRMRQPAGEPAELERSVLDAWGVPEADRLDPPRGVRLRGARRPLRVRPTDAACQRAGDDALELCFTLPAGSYATVLVESLLGPPAPRAGAASSTARPGLPYPCPGSTELPGGPRNP